MPIQAVFPPRIEGTLDNPWGNLDIAEFDDALASFQCIALLVVDATAMGFGEQTAWLMDDGNFLVWSLADVRSNVSDTVASTVAWSHDDGHLMIANILVAGAVVDMMPYASSIPTSLQVAPFTTANYNYDYTALIDRSITDAVVPEGVKWIGEYAFANCRWLTSVNLPNSLEGIAPRAFSECGSLASIYIPSGVTIIGDDAFSNCFHLDVVRVMDNVNSIGQGAFRACDSISWFEINALVPPFIYDETFDGCDNIQFYVPFEAVDAYRSAPIWSQYADRIQAL